MKRSWFYESSFQSYATSTAPDTYKTSGVGEDFEAVTLLAAGDWVDQAIGAQDKVWVDRFELTLLLRAIENGSAFSHADLMNIMLWAGTLDDLNLNVTATNVTSNQVPATQQEIVNYQERPRGVRLLRSKQLIIFHPPEPVSAGVEDGRNIVFAMGAVKNVRLRIRRRFQLSETEILRLFIRSAGVGPSGAGPTVQDMGGVVGWKQIKCRFSTY